MSEPMRGTLRIDFLSDWHCGTGQGRHAGVDRVVARDSAGLPYVPAKTLLGLWRDACEKAAFGLDDGVAGEWTKLVGVIFGAPAGAADDPDTAGGIITVRPARLPSEWRAALIGNHSTRRMLREALTVERYGVKIDESSGIAEDDTLRLVERARSGLPLGTGFSVAVPSSQWAVELLLQAGAALWHHIGSNRRRGAGRCEVTLSGLPNDVSALVRVHGADVKDFTVASVERLGATPEAAVTTVDPASAPTYTRRARVRITTLLPVICSRMVQGNVATGHDFIPGGTILPVVARSLGTRSQALIRDGHVQVSDATPVIGGHRALVTPRTVVARDKGRRWRQDGQVIDALIGDSTGAKPIGGWAAVADGVWRVAYLGLAETAHANIDDASQRPGNNGLYTFQAIPAGTVLECEIRATDAVTSEEWAGIHRLDGTEQTVGRYRRGDYGLVELSFGEAKQDTPHKASGRVRDVTLVLDSDAYVTDDLGLPNPTAQGIADDLSSRLGTGVEVVKALVSVNRRDSWSGLRALPRTTRACLAAGSVIALRTADPVDAPALAEIVDSGIGGYRGEGLGRIRLTSDLPTQARETEVDQMLELSSASTPTDEAWLQFTRLAWQQEIDQMIRLAAVQDEFRQGCIPAGLSRSQRGTLREAARSLLADQQAVSRWLEATRGHEGKSRQWGAKSLQQIENLATPSPDWARRLANALNDALKEQGFLESSLPADLGGAASERVAASLLSEMLGYQALTDGQDGE